MKITCFTDGSAVIKYPKLGGFGIYIKTPTKSFKIRKGYFGTKTGRMEITAVIYCLKSITNKSSQVTIYSDSMYVVNTCNLWLDGWISRGWLGIKNVDLLKVLNYELKQFSIKPKLRHVKGHQKVVNEFTHGNNIADELASYKTQKNWVMDEPFDDLNEIEKLDFKEINGKTYYNGRI